MRLRSVRISIEHCLLRDEIPDATYRGNGGEGDRLRSDSECGVEAIYGFQQGKTDLLKRSLVQQVASKELLTGTEHAASSDEMKSFRERLGRYPMSMELGGAQFA